MLRSFLLFLIIFVGSQAFAKIRILTFHCSCPYILEMQCKTLNKFLLDDFELIVFNDAKTEESEKLIESVCYKYQVKCVRFLPEWHFTDPLNGYLQKRLQEPTTIGHWGWNGSTTNEELGNHPSVRHCHVIQYALDNFGYDHDDIVVIMDGDNFIIKPISIRELLGSNDIVGFHQRADEEATLRKRGELKVPKNTEMPWVVFIAFNPRKLPDVRELQFHVDVVNGRYNLPDNTIVDTGAAIYKYLSTHPELKLETYPWQSSYTYRYMSFKELKQMNLDKDLVGFIHDLSPENVQFFVYEHFMHFGAGSYEGPNHEWKCQRIQKYINDILKRLD